MSRPATRPVVPLTDEQQQIVLDNMKLVYYTYNDTYKNPSKVIQKWEDDIIQEGMYGLCKAAVKFDPSLGNEFATFAVPCIRNQMALLVRKIKNDWMVDSLDEMLDFDKGGDSGVSKLDTIADTSISADCIVANQQDKELALRIAQVAASERAKFAITQILTNNMRLRDVYLQFYADKSYYCLTKTVELACRKIRNIVEKVAYIPREEDYETRDGFLVDMKRLWGLHDPSNFKPSKKYLKQKEQI